MKSLTFEEYQQQQQQQEAHIQKKIRMQHPISKDCFTAATMSAVSVPESASSGSSSGSSTSAYHGKTSRNINTFTATNPSTSISNHYHSHPKQPQSPQFQFHHRPILVGYAFGPKKMSTMSVVMAEASKAVSTVVTHFPPHLRNVKMNANIHGNGNSNGNEIQGECNRWTKEREREQQISKRKRNIQSMTSNASVSPCPSPSVSHSHSLSQLQDEDYFHEHDMVRDEAAKAQKVLQSQSQSQHELDDSSYREEEEAEYESMGTNLDDTMHMPMHAHMPLMSTTPLPKITCIFPDSFFLASSSSSSCKATPAVTATATVSRSSYSNSNSHGYPSSSSLGEASILTATSTGSASGFGGWLSSGGGSSIVTNINANADQPQHLQPMKVCFVPLDLDAPLDEQHGGKFDAILHKMTEDILCKSQLEIEMSMNIDMDVNVDLNMDSKTNTQSQINVQGPLDESERQALKRIGRLRKYKSDHPACCLVDHPDNVQALMSRSHIADTLSECLKGITTRSGISVRTPQYQVLPGREEGLDSGSNSIATLVAKQIDGRGLRSNFRYPFIVKPLTAAGTKHSHKMGVLLGRHGLEDVCGSGAKSVCGPSLLQEYSNHDGLLYKVYVLGDKVWVFQRPSLPNLPLGERNTGEGMGYVEFDSQRPYPTLDDFGIGIWADKMCAGTSNGLSISSNTANISESDQGVTVAEIRPVADTIRKAFGLELFGFDILVTSGRRKELLVVDVNYFPSYKEVTNFPKMLAQYLAQCGIEGRLRSSFRP